MRKIVALFVGEHGIKSYLTVNTVIYGEDLPSDEGDHRRGEGGGSVSAIIAADVAAMSYANSIGQEVHLIHAAEHLERGGAEVLRPLRRCGRLGARAELESRCMRSIRQIVDAADHGPERGTDPHRDVRPRGSLCMAVSGKCYLSLHEMNASANRGACMQICRRAYSVHDKDSQIELDVENQYIMSPKDLEDDSFHE